MNDTTAAGEGCITGHGDSGFHAPILREDRLTPAIVERLREEARRMGIDPRVVQR